MGMLLGWTTPQDRQVGQKLIIQGEEECRMTPQALEEQSARKSLRSHYEEQEEEEEEER